ncbi:hypothetical protein Nepgr_018366 [Nepenthes gracilis]|uniref:Nuclear transcription factor Y subunit n=1 Tax=Nepenthes gracilis TaxID=150966 RepID=A0AAD3ST69_NEPGR|nr:hypothetical protein Nepgr_018366 [Nepenthes gracilis]
MVLLREKVGRAYRKKEGGSRKRDRKRVFGRFQWSRHAPVHSNTTFVHNIFSITYQIPKLKQTIRDLVLSSMSQLYANCPSYWKSNEQRISESLSKSLSLNVESPPQFCPKATQLGFQLQDHDSSSSISTTQSNHDATATIGTNSQDQCISSEFGQEVNCGKSVEHQVKPLHLDAAFNPPQIDYNHTMTCIPYPCADPYLSGLLAAYGPPPMIHPQMMGMMGMTAARVPLPLDNLTENEPIYVNAKQYHGILRRRQSRAKLEAQNKLIKVRKPYLHKSRHLHALNRIRGSGGRFLGTKKLQQTTSDPTPGTHPAPEMGFEQHNHQSQSLESIPVNPGSGIKHFSNGSLVFQQQPDLGLSGASAAACIGGSRPDNGGFLKNPRNQNSAPVVR